VSKTQKYLDKLSEELENLGHQGAASDVSSLSSSLSFEPMDLAFASGKLNLEAFSESGDESEIDADHVLKVLVRAKIYGFGGECAEAAIAINDVLFNEEGRLVAAINKWIWDNEKRIVGHVAVEVGNDYWDANGKKSWEEIESWGMLDENDPDYNLGDNPEENAFAVEKIYPSKEDLIDMFGGCNLKSFIRTLEEADKEVRLEAKSKSSV
jgi:hypothetical protein